MKKRFISLLLAFCMVFICATPAFADDGEYPLRKYYNLNVVHTDNYSNTFTSSIDFMVLRSSAKDTGKVYIKAEDFSLVTGGDYSYEYNQTVTECAYVSNSTGHVVRFMLNSDKVSVIYVGDNIMYTAPYDVLYENGVTWLPFEFAVKLFHLQAMPENGTIHITSSMYNPISIANKAHNEVRNLGFDWIDEVGQSVGGYIVGVTGATFASCTNKLLSLEPSAWGSMMAANFNSYYVDAGYAEIIAKAFISPSQQEIKETDKQFVKILANSADAYDNFMDINEHTSDVRDYITIKDIKTRQFIDRVLAEHPKLQKSNAVQNVQKAMKENKNNFNKLADEIFTEMGKQYDNFGDSSAKILDGFLTFVSVMENYLVFLGKNERAVSALQIYVKDSDYEEADVFERFATADNDFVAAVREVARDTVMDKVDGAITAGMGLFGTMLEAGGFVWDFVSGIGPLKTGIDAAENRMISEYAIRYQDDALGIYYDYRNKVTAAGGANEKALDEMVSALYAYLKFSYIARNTAAASFEDTSKTAWWKEGRNNAANSAKVLQDKNQKVAEYLVCMEKDIFTPSEASAYKWDDTVYADVLKTRGTPIENPTQDTVPVFEFPEFPDTAGIEYITEEEAIDLAKRVIDRFTGGMLNGMLGDILKEATGGEEIYTYEVVDNYINGEDMAYVVQMYTGGSPDAMFFVSVIGTEVWLGGPDGSGGYFVYTDLDLLHAGMGDLVGAIGDLSATLVGEIVKEEYGDTATGAGGGGSAGGR